MAKVVQRFICCISFISLLGCSPNEKTKDSHAESLEEHEESSKKYKANQRALEEEKMNIPMDDNARPFIPEKMSYSLPRKFDYSVFTRKEKLPSDFNEFYPIGYSSDFNYFCYISREIANENKFNFVLKFQGSGSPFKSHTVYLDSTNLLRNLDEVWNMDKVKIESALKKYRIIQEKPFDFKFKPGTNYSGKDGKINLGVIYQLSQLVTRKQGSTTTSEADTIQIDLHANYSDGRDILVHVINRAYNLIYGLQIPGAFLNEKNLWVIFVYYYHGPDYLKKHSHFDIFSISR